MRFATRLPRLLPGQQSPKPHRNPAPPAVVERVTAQAASIGERTGEPRFAELYRRLVLDTWERTLHPGPDGVFVITGDIPAMWLRDSAAQMRPFLALADEPAVAAMVAGVVRMQFGLVRHDPWANAFTAPSRRWLPWGGSRHLLDDHAWHLHPDRWIWERKYEVDSLAFPVQLAHALWQATGDSSHLDALVHDGVRRIVEVWQLEQDHQHSPYRFLRLFSHDSLPRGGRGAPVARTGMTWQGFRPSDDRVAFGYNIPAQLMAARSLRMAAEMCGQLWQDDQLARQALLLRDELLAGVEGFGLLPDGTWAYEVDGLGGVLAADDANLPSLLGLPLLADVAPDDPRYLATRRRILSSANPWWHAGSVASGIGSPHTPGRRVWPIALAVQGLTSTDAAERMRLARLLADTTAGTGRMHESFDVDDPGRFSRGWFSWADMMCCELLDSLAG